ncbi:MAG: hypothetical protein ACLFQZ_04775 [Spirochaetaceae bacterium]
MKANRFLLLLLIGAIVAVTVLPAQEVGGGISLFLPLSTFEHQEGSLSVETALESTIGLGPVLSLPFGIAYNQVWGLTPRGDDGTGDPIDVSAPWFYADALSPYLMVLVRVPAGPLFLDLYGGGVVNFNLTLRPLQGAMLEDFETLRQANGGEGSEIVGIDDLSVDSGVGYGFLAGAGVGMRFPPVRIVLSGTYRHLMHPLIVSGNYYDRDGDSYPFSTDDSGSPLYIEELELLLRGVAIGINASVEM